MSKVIERRRNKPWNDSEEEEASSDLMEEELKEGMYRAASDVSRFFVMFQRPGRRSNMRRPSLSLKDGELDTYGLICSCEAKPPCLITPNRKPT